MTEIKHVSFDVWGTLITANSIYALRRTQLVSEMFHLDTAVVKSAYTNIKKFVDDAAGEQGIAYSTDDVFAMFFDALNLPVPLSSEARSMMRDHFEALFRTYHPTIDATVRELGEFLRKRGVTMSIGSNSNFISGDVMFPFLQKNLDNMFEFGVFSDLEGAAKPNTDFFDIVLERVQERNDKHVFRGDILHVGDNRICDGIGALNSSMQAAVIDNPSQLFVAVRSRFL